MSTESQPELGADLLDDFYAECDEHLTNIRAQLEALEQAAARGESNPAALESLYRSAHSFKGNAAIVGLASAEKLAHAAEGLLRGLSRGEHKLSAAALDLLGQAGHRLEQITAAFRLRQALPEVEDLLAGFSSFSEPAGARAAPAGAGAWRATFAPSPDLDRRGINLRTLRERLGALGEIVSVTPAIQAGKVRFEFRLILAAAPADTAAWSADGVEFQPEDPAATAKLAAEAAEAQSGMAIAPSHIVRVDLSRLDELMRIAGDMVVQRSRLQDRVGALAGDRAALEEITLTLGRSLRDLRRAITRLRLVPVAEIFGRLPFVVRDLERNSGRKVRLALEGQDTEIDKYLVERLKEPLLHLVRNALSHGVEPAGERIAAGKPAEATLSLRASTVADSVLIQVEDDGRGIDAHAVAERAAAAGLAVPEVLDEPALLQLICTPGFSTRDQADRAAGRGVGMAVVADTVRELGGSLSLTTVLGQSTRFTLRLPLTLSIAETFIVSAAGQTCAVPQGAVEEIVQVESSDLRAINQTEVAPYRGGLLPLVRLRAVLGAEAAPPGPLPVLVITTERGSAGLAVDRVLGQREVVVRPLQDPLVRVPGVSAATELGDGRPVLILDPAALSPGRFASAGGRTS